MSKEPAAEGQVLSGSPSVRRPEQSGPCTQRTERWFRAGGEGLGVRGWSCPPPTSAEAPSAWYPKCGWVLDGLKEET